MSSEEIKRIVEEYFSNPPASVPKWSFSEKWKTDVCKKVRVAVNHNTTESAVTRKTEEIHNKEYEKLLNDLTTYFKKEWHNIDPSEVEDVVIEACTKFSTTGDAYDSQKGKNEKQHLFWRINNNLINESKRKKPGSLDETILHSHSDDEEDDTGVIEPTVDNNESEEEQKKETTDIKSYIQELPKDIYSRLAPHLAVLKPKLFNINESLFLEHSFPSRDFLLKDVPEEFNSIRDVEDFRLDVVGYSRYERIVESQERQFMLLAIERLKECRISFDKELDKMVEAAKNNGENVSKENLKERYPLLSAVAVDKNGDIIKTAFKGETGCIDKHCEYTLFEELFSDIDKKRMKGGALYVTLEPCNRRGVNKIPCAVRCVEAGISKIYIGTHDPDDTVKWKGATTIKTGKYSFNVDDKGNPIDSNIEAAKALMKMFDDKQYTNTCENGIKTYTIGSPIGKDNVHLFHPDLSLEIIQLNKEFLKGKENNAFVSFDMP